MRKGCSQDYRETKCTSTPVTATKTLMVECSCPYDFCNDDSELEESLGLKGEPFFHGHFCKRFTAENIMTNSAASTLGSALPSREDAPIRRTTIQDEDGTVYEIHETPLRYSG